MNLLSIAIRSRDHSSGVSRILGDLGDCVEEVDRGREFGEGACLSAHDVQEIVFILRECSERLARVREEAAKCTFCPLGE